MYRKGVGILLYLAPKRPDLMFALKKLSMKLASPTEGDLEPSELPVPLMPFPIAYLVTKGTWSTILILLRWHSALHQHQHRRPVGPIPTWPPGDAEVWEQSGQHARPPDEDGVANVLPLTAESLERFAIILKLPSEISKVFGVICSWF